LSFKLKQSNIVFNEADLSNLCELVDGHPFNARFAVRYAETYGLKSLLASPSELIEWKRRQAEKFLEGIKFDEVDSSIISLLRTYRYVAIETLVQIVDSGTDEITTSLRLLEDLCCVERRGDYYAIPKPLTDAMARDKRFQKTADWEQSISKKMSEILDEYQDEDHVSISVIETATLAAIKSGIESKIIANFLLPSHLLRIGRSYYDERNWGACLDFCEKAYGLKNRLTLDGRVESLRLIGLSAARLNDNKKLKFAISELDVMGGQNAKRQALFLLGFEARLRGRWVEAEENYLKAFAISRANMSLNRELAAIYCHQGRFSEAEDHARLAYEFSPNNPFIIDILARTISGKLSQGLSVDSSELDSLMTQLSRHENAAGSSFFDIRQAEILMHKKNFSAALKSVNTSITKTPGLVSSHCLRASINLALMAIPEAEKDVTEINRLLEQAGGYSPEDEAQLKELQVRIHIEKFEFQAAKDLADRSYVLPNSVKRRLLTQLAKAIGFESKYADRQLQQWSKSYKV
jgi:tetratricopeptide (TPR) repeat protein